VSDVVPDPLRHYRLSAVAATALLILSVPLYLGLRALAGPPKSAGAEPLYVGSEKCAGCHKPAFDKWKVSNHALAMQAAKPETVLGDFSGATWKHRGKTWRFYRRDGKFLVQAEGPDGALHEYEIAYTFGIRPLQQYLVPFPGGRLQCLSAAWDTERKRWFFVYPGRDDIPPDDWLHWTRPGQNWNTMCADCHSTAVQKRYDVEADLFRTTWSEIAVGCEACHGPGSLHVAWADQPAMARPAVENFALTTRTSNLPNVAYVNLCMSCHSRRAQFADQGWPGGEPLDHYLPVTLGPGVFYPDGQILDEDFEYHSFVQSKMYARGVKCGDCHDVHRARRYKEGNELCTRCHRADTYDVETHHFHKKLVKGRPSDGALCTSCHMPGQYYMVVHFRRDHSMRVPRPDLSVSLGTPNACSAAGCHADKPLSWSVAAYEKWYGKARKPHWGTAIAAGRTGAPEAKAALVLLAGDGLSPAIARATALDLLGGYGGADVEAVFGRALADPDDLIRRTAVARYPGRDADRLVRLLAPRLSDPVTAVRIEAAARLAEAPAGTPTDAQQALETKALAEYVAAQRYMSDMPSGPYNLANLALAQGNRAEAERLYRRSLQIDDRNVPAKVNLALLLAATNRLDEAESLLRSARSLGAGAATVSFNLGLLLAERGKSAEAEEALRAALKADPNLAPAAYNLGALVGEKNPREGAALCRRAASLDPDQPRYGFSQAFFEARAGNPAAAIATLEALLARQPGYADAWVLLGRLYLGEGRKADAIALYRKGAATDALPAEARHALEGFAKKIQ
jgi:tetratricopeptide (TPR) repeat protein